MKIEGQNAKILNILKQIQQLNQQISDENQMQEKNILGNTPLPSSLTKLSPELQQLILQNWLNSDLPLKNEYIEQLVTLMESTGTDEFNNSTLIKSYIMLLKNNLPLSPLLLRSLARNLNPEKTLSQTLFRLMEHTGENGKIQPGGSNTADETKSRNTAAGMNNQTQRPEVSPEQTTNNPAVPNSSESNPVQGDQKEILSTLLNKLGIEPQLPADKLAQKINDYAQQMTEVITTLSNLENVDTGEAREKLLGQFLVNTDIFQNTDLLLWLELPLLITEPKPTPLYLEIRKHEEEDKQDQQQEKKNFKISFMIDLPQRGPIQADVFLQENIINGHFRASGSKTVSLIRKNLSLLEENLENLGYEIEKFLVENIEEWNRESKTKTVDLFNPLPEELHFSDNTYQHIDIRI